MQLAERYELITRLHDGRNVSVHRARDRRSGEGAVLKIPKPGISLARLRGEHAILEDLDVPGVVRARALETYDSEIALVLDDHGGETLGALLARGRLPLREALRITAEIAGTLGKLHDARVIHKDINPNNILVDDGGRAWLFDFDIATRLHREIQSIRTPNLLAGTLPYISPEQTGRMNRAIDHRTDLYSLGVTLYAALAGHVPFESQDPMELVHCHIAKVPPSPREIEPSIPEVVSAIAMKLLAKTAEDRYQSGSGLQEDLEECLRRLDRRLDEGAPIEPFPLGAHDMLDRFQIPEKLYGRQGEIASLEAAFEASRQGPPGLLLVTGSSGVGKSSVIHELYKSLSHTRGGFVSGKFDQLKRDIPYSALLAALGDLVRTLLAETEEQLALVRRRILAALHGLGRLIVDVLPDLERVIGPQPPVEELSGAEAGNRFRFAFESFLRAFTRHGEPLVVFLDDLQWADAATLDLVTALLSDPRSGALLIIGAYRDNEVAAKHPLLSAVDAVEKSGCKVTRIHLGPLEEADVSRLVEDTLSITPSGAAPLADLLFHRTGGNPLFAGELLVSFHRAGLVVLDRGRGRWTFDLPSIEQAPGTDNVGQLMAARAAALAPHTQEILRLAAVLGNRFDIEPLITVSARPEEEVTLSLAEALREGLLVAMRQGARLTYRFLHDRVQQAVYASIPEDKRTHVHHGAGKLLLANRPADEADEWLFGVLHHLNLAPALVTDPRDRLDLAQLNLKAAMRALASGAFGAAANHYAQGTGFLSDGAWESRHELMFRMHLGQAECEYLRGDHESAERLFARLRTKAANDEERILVLELTAIYQQHLWRLREALRTIFAALALLGIDMNESPGTARVLADFARTRLAVGSRSTADLLRLPEARDPQVLFSLRLIVQAAGMATLIDANLSATLYLKTVRLSIEHGNSRHAAMGYATYGLVLIGILGDHRTAEAYGRLALQVLERYPDKRVETTVRMGYGLFIHPWCHPVRESLRYQDEAQQCGELSGELVFACYAPVAAMVLSTFAGVTVDSLYETSERGLEMVRRYRHDAAVKTLLSFRQVALALRGQTFRLGDLDGEGFDEAKNRAELAAYDSKMIFYEHQIARVMVLVVFERNADALAVIEPLRKDATLVLGSNPFLVDFHYHDALVLLALADGRSALQRQLDILRVRTHLHKLKKWAETAPMNFRHKHALVAAELSRVTGADRAAIEGYEQAIALAKESGFLHDEAIALERAAGFYRSRGLLDIAVSYVSRARQAYARWGATGKVAELDRAYPGLAGRSGAADSATNETSVTTTSSTSTSSGLDAPSMIKASQALSGEISLDRLLLRLMGIVAENAGAERGVLVLREPGAEAGATVIAAEFSTKHGARLPATRVPVLGTSELSEGIVNYVFRTGQSMILADAAKEGPFTADAYVTRRKPRALLCMPLLQKGEVSGALYLENNLVPGAFSPDRAGLLGVLCAQLAISIDNAYLYADMERQIVERTRALREAQARLVQFEKETTENQMAGGFAHEMRNALAGARLVLAKIRRDGTDSEEEWSVCAENSQRLSDLFVAVQDHVPDAELDQVAGILREMNMAEERVDTVLKSINRSLERGLGITGLLLRYAEMGRDQPGFDELDLTTVVDTTLESLSEQCAARGIDIAVDVPRGCAILADERHIHSILQNLLLNAADALLDTAPGARSIRVHAVDGLERVVITVSDTGPGIPAELREKIFEPFFSTKPETGTGLGLGMVRKLASLYGGSVDLDTPAASGASFRLVLPRAQPPGR